MAVAPSPKCFKVTFRPAGQSNLEGHLRPRAFKQLCEIPGMHSWRIGGFPMQWLYFEADDHFDVVRPLGD